MKFVAVSLLVLIALPLCGQSKFEMQVLKTLQKDQLGFEKVYVQTNKAHYAQDDTIWFQAYVGNGDNRPSLETTRLHVNLLNAKGIVVSAKNIFIENGTGSGQFEKIYLHSGTYFIQAYTQNMRNFGTDTFYSQEFEVFVTEQFTSPASHATNYDIKIFPEGGYFLENATGTAAIKALKNGLGTDFSAIIVNSKNQVLQQFPSTHLGIAKFDLNYQAGETYTAVLKFKDTVITRQLPEARKEGVLLSLDNSGEKLLKINLKTNANTLKSPFNGSFSVLSHQRNHIGAHVAFKKMDSLNAVIVLNKAKLNHGVNTITLFKDEKPIAERSFFVEKRDAKIQVELQKISSGIDSLRYRIKLSKKGKPVAANLSIAVFPENSKSFEENQNIESAFLLTPFIDEYLEDPAYYFNEKNKNRSESLDLVLLSQAVHIKSKEEFIAYNNPSKVFEPERGYSISGGIAPPFLSNRFALASSEGNIVDELILNGNKHFKFNNLLLFKGDTLKFTFLDDFRTLKPHGVTIDTVETDFPAQPLPLKIRPFDRKISFKQLKF